MPESSLSSLASVRQVLARRLAVLSGLLMLGGLIAACGSDSGGGVVVPPVDVGSILINQPNTALERNTHVQLSTTIKSSTGTPLNIAVVWRSSNEKVATVDVNGRVTAVDTGTATITASTVGSKTAGVLIGVYQLVTKIEAFQYTPLAANSPGSTPDSLRVLVTGDKGVPIPGRKVKFAVTAGGGSVSPTTATTNAQGIAAVAWTTGPTAGVNTVAGTVLTPEDENIPYISPNTVTFTLRTFDALLPVAGNNQSGVILSPLPVEPSVKVVDSTGKPRPGIPVQFAATSGGRVASSVVSTGADGIASPGVWTLGDVPGEQSLVARVENSKILLKATGTGTPIYYLPLSISAGTYVSCAIVSDQTASCWGEEPKVGDSSTVNKSVPTPVKKDIKYTRIRPGINSVSAHVCAIATDQSIYCWGQNAIVDTAGKVFSTVVPVQYPTDLKWLDVAPGQVHNCALATDNQVYCWGDNTVGQLGDRNGGTATAAKRYTPSPVFGGFRFTAVTSGGGHTCGLATDGSAFCWGNNPNGQLGMGTTQNQVSPTAVSGGLVFKEISAGDSFTCGITTTGKAYCWGNLGPGSTVVTTPRAYSTAPDFVSITTGGGHACALTADNSAYCWGDNSGGQLGDSTTTYRANPTAVATTVKFKSITGGFTHTCGLATNGAAMCWGLNHAGELGDSTLTVNAIRTQPRYIVLGVTPPAASSFKARK